MKMGIVVTDEIEANEKEDSLYKVYKVTPKNDINALINQAFNEGCSSVLAFVESSKEAAMVKHNQAVETFVTKCTGVSAGFYVKQAEMFIKARIGFEDICKSIMQTLHNYSSVG